MKPLIIIILLLGISISVLGQQEIKFKIEELSLPERLIIKRDYEDVYKWLILSDVNMIPFQVDQYGIDYPYNIIAKSEAPDSLVVF